MAQRKYSSEAVIHKLGEATVSATGGIYVKAICDKNTFAGSRFEANRITADRHPLDQP